MWTLYFCVHDITFLDDSLVFVSAKNGFHFDPCRLGVPVYILVVDTFSAQADLNVNRLITRSVVHLGTSPAHGGQIVKKSS